MESMELATLWTGMLAELKKSLPLLLYMNWFESSLIPLSYKNNELVLATTQQFILTFINKNYVTLLNDVAQKVTGQPIKVHISLMNDPAVMPSASPSSASIPADDR